MVSVVNRRASKASDGGRVVVTAGIVLLVCLLVVRLFVLEPRSVESDSMEPGLGRGDVVLLNRLGPPLFGVANGDIVAVRNPTSGEAMVKRVIALGGQSVATEGATLLVDGKPVPEPYVDHRQLGGIFFGPVTVPEGSVFVMGDNRLESIDSREFGSVPLSSVEGSVLVIWRYP